MLSPGRGRVWFRNDCWGHVHRFWWREGGCVYRKLQVSKMHHCSQPAVVRCGGHLLVIH